MTTPAGKAARFAVDVEPGMVTIFDDSEDPDGMTITGAFRIACVAAGWHRLPPGSQEQSPEPIRHNRWAATQQGGSR